MYKRVVVKRPDFVYAKVKLEFAEDSEDLDIDALIFKTIIIGAINTVFGEVGCSVTVDILKFSAKSREAILRVPSSCFLRVRSALTLLRTYERRHCAFHTLQVSPHLMSLAVDSRNINQ